MKQEINQSKEERNQQLMSLTRRQENELKKLCSPDARDFVSLKSGKDSVGAMEISNSL